MHDAMAVRVIEGAGNLDGIAQCLVERQRPLLQPLRESIAFQILHDQVINVVLLAHIVERADIRVIQAGNRAGLTLEAFAELRLSGKDARAGL